MRQTEDRERTKKLLEHLVSPELHAYYDLEALHLFVIGHENGHSLGPDSDYQNALGLYGHIVEEHKADVISVAMMPEYVKAGVIDRETLYKVYATWIISSLLLRAEPQLSHPHRVADLIQFNYLLEHGVLSFTKDEKLKIDFLKLPDVMNQLLEETIAVQLSKSPEFAKRFIDNYARWGEISRRIAAVQRQLGLKPYKLIKSKF